VPEGELVIERVNEVTCKVTDGVKVRTAASLGWFGGREDTRALAWLMDVGWPGGKSSWVVRMGDVAVGPMSFAHARRAALKLVIGAYEEPVRVVRDAARELDVHAAEAIVDESVQRRAEAERFRRALEG
jgi:hypothetical protein